MSIATTRGDQGMTDLMYGRRVPKTNPRVAACGAIDELNAALGIVRTVVNDFELVAPTVRKIQKELIVLMGELATDDQDRDRYASDGYKFVEAEMVSHLTALVDRMEQDFNLRFKGWATPGENTNPASAYIDLARTICRRSERCVLTLHEQQPLPNAEVVAYLNRLSDVLWLFGRYEDCLSKGDDGAD